MSAMALRKGGGRRGRAVEIQGRGIAVELEGDAAERHCERERDGEKERASELGLAATGLDF